MKKRRIDVRIVAAAALAGVFPALSWADMTLTGAQSITVDTTNPVGSNVFFVDGHSTADGDFVFSNNATYFNQGTFTAGNDRAFSGSGTFSNTGFFNKAGTSGTTTFLVPFIGGGATQVSQGTLSFNDGGTTGTITIAPSSTLVISSANSFTGGPVVNSGYFEPTAGSVTVGAITGTGYTNLEGLTTVAAPTIQQSGLIDDGYGLTLTSTAASTVGTFAINNATIAGSAPDGTTIQSTPTVLNVTAGASLGNSTLQKGILLNLNGTTYGNGNNIAGDANAVMNIPSGAVFLHTTSGSTYVSGITTNVAGTVSVSGGGSIFFNAAGTQSGTFNIGSGSTIAAGGSFTGSAVVNDAGTFDILGIGTVFNGSLNVSNNATLQVDGSSNFSSSSVITLGTGVNLSDALGGQGVVFNNRQVLAFNNATLSGSITFRNSGISFNSLTYSNPDPGGEDTLSFQTGGTVNINTLNVGSASLNSGEQQGFATTLNVGTFNLSGGSVLAVINVTNVMNFTGGQLDGGDGTQGVVTIEPTGFLNYSGGTLTRGAVLNNLGSFLAPNGFLVGAGNDTGLTEAFNTNSNSSNVVMGVLGAGNNGTLVGGSGQGTINASSGSMLHTDSILLGSTAGGIGALNITGNAAVFADTDVTVSAGSSLTLSGGGSLNISSGVNNFARIRPLIAGLPTFNQVSGVSTVGSGSYIYAQVVHFTGDSPVINLSANQSNPGKLYLPSGSFVTFTTGTGTAVIASQGNAAMPGAIDLQNSTNHTFTVDQGMTLNVSAAITNGGFTVGGGGTLMLSGTNSFTGGIVVSDANTTLIPASPAALMNSTLQVSGGSLQLQTGTGETNYGFSISSPVSDVAIAVNANSSAGTVDINALTVNSGSQFGTTGTGTLKVLGNTQIGYNTALPWTISNSTNVLFDSPVTESGQPNGMNIDIIKQMPGTVTFSGQSGNSFGNMNIASGKLILDQGNGAAIPNNLEIHNGAIVQLALSNQISTAASITLNGALGNSLLDLNGFNNTLANLFFIAGGTMNTGTGTASLAAGGSVNFTGSVGTATINGNLSLVSGPINFNLQAGAAAVDLQVNANLTGSNAGITETGGGVLDLAGASSFTGPLNISNGSVHLDGTLSAPVIVGSTGQLQLDSHSGPILVRSLGAVTLNATQSVSPQLIAQPAANSSNRQLLVISSLSLAGAQDAWQARVDLANNDLDVPGGSLATMTNQIKEGYNAGGWNGAAGIISSSAAITTSKLTTLGIIQNNQGGTALFTAVKPFDTVSPGASDILVKYTYYGDTNLDGKVDGSDYSRIDAAYLADQSKPTTDTGWYNGDFNYDGVINGSDYTLIDNAFNTQGAALSSQIVNPSANIASEIAGSAVVPEPATSAALLLGALLLASRRRRDLHVPPDLRRR